MFFKVTVLLEENFMTPSPTNFNGRSPRGTFASGNKFGIGDPNRSKVQKLRVAMLEVIEPNEVKAIVLTLVGLAQTGDLKAAKRILDIVGRPEDMAASATEIQITAQNFEEAKRELLAITN
jgi:hypothetical protein